MGGGAKKGGKGKQDQPLGRKKEGRKRKEGKWKEVETCDPVCGLRTTLSEAVRRRPLVAMHVQCDVHVQF